MTVRSKVYSDFHQFVAGREASSRPVRTLETIVGHSPGIGYPSSRFIPDDRQSGDESKRPKHLGVSWGDHPHSLLPGLLMIWLPGPPNPFFFFFFFFSAKASSSPKANLLLHTLSEDVFYFFVASSGSFSL